VFGKEFLIMTTQVFHGGLCVAALIGAAGATSLTVDSWKDRGAWWPDWDDDASAGVDAQVIEYDAVDSDEPGRAVMVDLTTGQTAISKPNTIRAGEHRLELKVNGAWQLWQPSAYLAVRVDGQWFIGGQWNAGFPAGGWSDRRAEGATGAGSAWTKQEWQNWNKQQWAERGWVALPNIV
jgi:hypothetical protein